VVERRLRKPWLFTPVFVILIAAALAVLAIEDHAGGEGPSPLWSRPVR
jgi:hypothetical protein